MNFLFPAGKWGLALSICLMLVIMSCKTIDCGCPMAVEEAAGELEKEPAPPFVLGEPVR